MILGASIPPICATFMPTPASPGSELMVTLLGPVDPGVATFFMPSDVDWSTYPGAKAMSPGCTPEIFSWAEATGKKELQGQVVRLTNIGERSLSLMEMAAAEVHEEEATSGSFFHCPNAGENGYIRAYANLDVRNTFRIDGTRPFGARLEPGESLDIEVHVEAGEVSRYGNIRFSVLRGKSAEEILIQGVNSGPLWSASSPLRSSFDVYQGAPGGRTLDCIPTRSDPSSLGVCTVGEDGSLRLLSP